MARFRGTVKGQRGEVSRLGNKVSGLFATINGWNIGVMIEAVHENGRDIIRVWETGGSNNQSHPSLMREIVDL